MSTVKSIKRLIFLLVVLVLVVSCATPTAAPVPTTAPVQPTAVPATAKPPEPTKAPVSSSASSASVAAPTAVPAAKYSESPLLADQVKAGKLPPVEQRLPANPLVVKGEKVGTYGGTWRMGMTAGTDDPSFYKIFAYEPLVRWNVEWTDIRPLA